jgi:hypothetical protein
MHDPHFPEGGRGDPLTARAYAIIVLGTLVAIGLLLWFTGEVPPLGFWQ